MSSLRSRLSPLKAISLRIYIYYFFAAFTFVSLYFNKYIKDDNLYGYVGPYGESGIKSVLNFQAIFPTQYRILVPYMYKFLSIFLPISGNYIVYIILSFFTFFILLAFYGLLNEYFKDKTINSWIAPIILYPLVRHVFFNDGWLYYDIPTLLFMILGFTYIVKEKYNLLLLVYIIGFFNKESVAYLAAVFFIYNFKNMLNKKYIFYFLLMVLLFFVIKAFMVNTLISSKYIATEQKESLLNTSIWGIFILNIAELKNISACIRLLFLSFGGLHIFILWALVTNRLKPFRSNLYYMNFIIIPFLLSAPFLFYVTDWRDYIEIVPFITILFLIAFSTLKNSFLQPTDRLLTQKNN
jgi:hypothetical protein